MFDSYTTVGCLCCYLMMLAGISTVIVCEGKSIRHIACGFGVCSLIIAIGWPIFLPVAAVFAPFLAQTLNKRLIRAQRIIDCLETDDAVRNKLQDNKNFHE